jgi:hypothetical protein
MAPASPAVRRLRNVLCVCACLLGATAVASDAVGDHWAFQPLRATPVPAHSGANPVDAFLLARLAGRGLAYSAPAERHALIRRATFDLTGLPPTPAEVDAFVADASPDAYEKLLDRLLGAPSFGERWGRHWLDDAGYVDVTSGDNDAAILRVGEGKWRYRDWVVAAFNDDEPFDRFLLEQLAGDELVDWRAAPTFTPETLSLLTATGFLRVAADDTGENELNTPDIRHGVLQRTLETFASNVLALTVNCAKCHDHKYDPISQADYFRLAAVFSPAFNPDNWLQPAQRQIPDVSPAQKAELERHNAAVDRQVAELREKQRAIRRPQEERLLEAAIAATLAIPEASRAAVKASLLAPPDTRDDAQKGLAARHEAALQVRPEEIDRALGDDERGQLASLEQQAGALGGTRRAAPGTLQAVYDAGPPTPTRLLRRGDHTQPGEEIAPGLLVALSPSPDAATIADAPPYAGTSGRRLALAKRLTDVGTPAGALVARVRVNRIWQHLFGRGIVPTGDNFGRQGTPPTHPELLEWLAGRFVADGWRLKPMLRLLMTSAAYRQSSAAGAPADPASASAPDPAAIDPANDLLWRMRLRRLESESVRDAVLSVSGKLDRTAGGPPVMTTANPDGSVVVSPEGQPTPTAKWRRSMYLLARRNYHPSVLNVFDQPLVATNCTARQASAVVTQSLTMLNDAFLTEQADFAAERLLSESGGDEARAVGLAFRLAVSRSPAAEESQWCAAFLNRHRARAGAAAGVDATAAQRQALSHLCLVLMNSSEFLYVP